jgi:hypothetical protein
MTTRRTNSTRTVGGMQTPCMPAKKLPEVIFGQAKLIPDGHYLRQVSLALRRLCYRLEIRIMRSCKEPILCSLSSSFCMKFESVPAVGMGNNLNNCLMGSAEFCRQDLVRFVTIATLTASFATYGKAITTSLLPGGLYNAIRKPSIP